jgi:cardiolipin synthase
MGDGRREGYWRQTDVRVEGHVVTDLQAAFAENWLEATGRALGGPGYFPRQERRGEVLAQVIRSSPEHGGQSMYAMYLFAISSAYRTIYPPIPTSCPTRAWIAKTGVGVKVAFALGPSITTSWRQPAGRGSTLLDLFESEADARER